MVELLRALAPTSIERARFVVTNAAGVYREDMTPGDVNVVKSFVDFHGGVATVRPSEGFFHTHRALHPRLREQVLEMGQVVPRLRLHESTFLWTHGPWLGSPEQAVAMRSLGVGTVGMSGWPEIQVAAHYDPPLPALFLNLITDRAWQETTHEANLNVGDETAPLLLNLLEALFSLWHKEGFQLPPKPVASGQVVTVWTPMPDFSSEAPR